MYCTSTDVQAILAENVVIGNRNIGVPVPGRVGSGSARSNISIPECNRYISLATQQIDGKLRPFYVTPLRRVSTFEAPIMSNIGHGSDVVVRVEDSGPFIQWDLVRVQNKYQMEYCNVKDVPTVTTIVLDQVVNDYTTVEESALNILKLPDPIPLITARLAASFIYDRLYTQSNSPEISVYGKNQRTLATNAIDDILRGIILLMGQNHTGRRFVRGSLFDAFSAAAEIQKGEEKET